MIILIRHGEATHHTQKLTGGWTDSEESLLLREEIRLERLDSQISTLILTDVQINYAF